jgi:hypothetical protein
MYRLLRGGAAARSVELCVETGVLSLLCPFLGEAVGASMAEGAAAEAVGGSDERMAVEARERFWLMLDALDESVREHGEVPSNGMLVAALCAPFCREAIEPERGRVRDAGEVIDEVLRPVAGGLFVSRRDAERARQILLVQRRLGAWLQKPGSRSAAGLLRRDYHGDAVWLHRLIATADGALDEEIARIEHLRGGRSAPAPAPSSNGSVRAAGQAGEAQVVAHDPGAGLAQEEEETDDATAERAVAQRRRRRRGRRRAGAVTAATPTAHGGGS